MYAILKDIPHYEFPKWVAEDRAEVENEDAIKWSPKDKVSPPPAIGTRITVTMNSIGPGTVRGYFVEDNWLGLLVELHDPPIWWRKQNPDWPLGHIFGPEFKLA
jgi:hypothetical protein